MEELYTRSWHGSSLCTEARCTLQQDCHLLNCFWRDSYWPDWTYSLERKVTDQQAQQKSYHDAHSKDREFVIGEKVLVLTQILHGEPKWLKGTIIEQTGPVSWKLETELEKAYWPIVKYWSRNRGGEWWCSIWQLLLSFSVRKANWRAASSRSS